MTLTVKLRSPDTALTGSFAVGEIEEVGPASLECLNRSRELGAAEVVLFVLTFPANVLSTVVAAKIVDHFTEKVKSSAKHGTSEVTVANPDRPDVTTTVSISWDENVAAGSRVDALTEVIEQGRA